MGIKLCSQDGTSRTKRSRSAPKAMLRDYFVTEHLPSEKTHDGRFRPILVEMVDTVTAELDSRFKGENSTLWCAMGSLLPSAGDFLEPKSLKVLFEYALTVPLILQRLRGKSFDNLCAECQVFKPVLSAVEWNLDSSTKSINLNDVAGYVIKNYSSAACILSNLYRLGVTAGYASVTNECSFSSLQQVDAPRRRSMSPYRECDLTFLFFERKQLDLVTFEEFQVEWYKKPRRL